MKKGDRVRVKKGATSWMRNNDWWVCYIAQDIIDGMEGIIDADLTGEKAPKLHGWLDPNTKIFHPPEREGWGGYYCVDLGFEFHVCIPAGLLERGGGG